MKSFMNSALIVAAFAATSVLSAADLKGLNVLMTSADAQTQMMGRAVLPVQPGTSTRLSSKPGPPKAAFRCDKINSLVQNGELFPTTS